MGDEDRPGFPWPWLLPSLALLAALTVWGVGVYPHLPERVPRHMGPDGVDAWTGKSVGAVFLPVLLHAGTTALTAAVAATLLRMRPADRIGPHERTSSLLNRPATRASALRTARATLLLGFCVGLSIAATCAVMWRTEPDPDVPAWLFAAALVPIGPGVVPVLAAAARDRRERPRRPGRRCVSRAAPGTHGRVGRLPRPRREGGTDMSDYSGPYGTDHDPSEMMKARARKKEREAEERARQTVQDARTRPSSTRKTRPGDEGEGEETGE
ncbi:DUF1648 domain-containing protein [Streptomyces macrosporus]|uniref:DUF1648 domain-containing protein n=1 Tax=Streptomyces macrosporus TaxID=44032 RepID=A0ABP5XQX4_9ACTN